jgi:hypothetical protein
MNPKKREPNKVTQWLWRASIVAVLGAELACFPSLDADLMSGDFRPIVLDPQPDARADPGPGLDVEQVAIADLRLPDGGAPGHAGLDGAAAADGALPQIDSSLPDSSLPDASLPDASLPDQLSPMLDAAPKEAQPPADPGSSVVINEVYPGSGTDWFELHNLGNKPVDLSSYSVTDLSNAAAAFPAGTTILPGQYKIFTMSGAPGWPGFKLSKNGDVLQLLDGSLKKVNVVNWGPVPDTKSWARVPDGTGAFQLTVITKGAANQGQVTP